MLLHIRCVRNANEQKSRIKHIKCEIEVSFKSDLIFIRSMLFQDLWHFMEDKFLFVIFFLQSLSLACSVFVLRLGSSNLRSNENAKAPLVRTHSCQTRCSASLISLYHISRLHFLCPMLKLNAIRLSAKTIKCIKYFNS